MSPAGTPSYRVRARSRGDGIGQLEAKSSSVVFDRSWNPAEPSDLPGPGELLAAAFAACVIKNVERFSQVLPFAYDSAEIDVELHRQDRPPCFDRIEYSLRVATDEPANRVDLLKRNLMKYGTVYNTLAAACEVTGRIETRPTSDETKPARQ